MNHEDLKTDLQRVSAAKANREKGEQAEAPLRVGRRLASQLEMLETIKVALLSGYDFDRYESLDLIYLEAAQHINPSKN